MLPTPNIDLSKILECQKYLNEGSHRRLYTFSPSDYKEAAGIWGNGEMALLGDPPGELELRRSSQGRPHPQPDGRHARIQPGLPPRGNVRDRIEALQEVALNPRDLKKLPSSGRGLGKGV